MADQTRAVDSEALKRLAVIVKAGGRMDSRDLVAVGRSAHAILAALGSIPELERELAEARETVVADASYLKHVEAISDGYRQRAERVEAAARKLRDARVAADVEQAEGAIARRRGTPGSRWHLKTKKKDAELAWGELMDLIEARAVLAPTPEGSEPYKCSVCGTTDDRYGHADDCRNGPAGRGVRGNLPAPASEDSDG